MKIQLIELKVDVTRKPNGGGWREVEKERTEFIVGNNMRTIYHFKITA